MTSNPTPLSPDDDRDFQQLIGVFDRPIAPCPAFAERLRQQAIAASSKERETAMDHVAPTPITTASTKEHRVIPMPGMRRSGGRILEIIAAAVLVVALLGSMFMMNRLQNGPSTPGPDPNDHRLAAVSSPIASAAPEPGIQDSESSARGGDLGSTSVRSLVTSELTLPIVPHSLAWTHVVADPLWIMPYGDVVASLGSSDLTVQDATTGDILWTAKTEDAFRNSQYDTERNPTLQLAMRAGPYARPWIEANTLYYATTTEIVGVDLHSGDEVFRTLHTVPESEDASQNLRLPINMSVRNGTAYLLTSLESGQFNLMAIDLSTGEQSWQHRTGEATEGSSTAYPYQLVVTNDLIVMQTRDGDANTLLALHASDGSVAWEQPNALTDDPATTNLTTNISAINDDYLVLTHQILATGTTDGEPNADEVMGGALYNLADGSLIWTAHEGDGNWPSSEDASGTCWIIPGWDETALYVSCSTETALNLFRIPFEGDGVVEQVGAWNTDSIAYVDAYSDDAAYFNTKTSVIRIDLASGARSDIPLAEGEACTDRVLPANSILTCINDNDLGTYTIQGFVSATDSTAAPSTPTSSPAASPQVPAVQADARAALLTNDPGHTSAWPAGYDPAQTGAPVRLDNIRVSPNASVISGDTLIVSGKVEEKWASDRILTFGTQAIDLVTGEELWYTNTGLTGNLVVNDWAIYGYQTDPEYPRTSGTLVSLSLATGELELMISPLAATPNGTVPPTTDLLMIGTHLYVPFPNGSVSSYSQGGQIEWTYETGLSFPDNWGWNPHNVAGDENFIYAAGPDGAITKLDRLTGKVVSTFQLDTVSHKGSWMDLHVRTGTLVAVVHPPDDPDRTPEVIVVMSADSGEVRWTQEVDYVTGNVVLSDTMFGIGEYTFADDPTSQADIVFYNILSGDVLATREILSTTTPDLSASGDIACIYTIRVECGEIDSLERVVSGVAFPNAFGANPPVMFWNDQLVIVNTQTGVYTTGSVSEPVESESSDFQPDYQSTSTFSINLRSGPGLSYHIVATVPEGRALQYLDESRPPAHPEEDGLAEDQVWMKVRTESGNEGWIREVDVTEATP